MDSLVGKRELSESVSPSPSSSVSFSIMSFSVTYEGRNKGLAEHRAKSPRSTHSFMSSCVGDRSKAKETGVLTSKFNQIQFLPQYICQSWQEYGEMVCLSSAQVNLQKFRNTTPLALEALKKSLVFMNNL